MLFRAWVCSSDSRLCLSCVLHLGLAGVQLIRSAFFIVLSVPTEHSFFRFAVIPGLLSQLPALLRSGAVNGGCLTHRNLHWGGHRGPCPPESRSAAPAGNVWQWRLDTAPCARRASRARAATASPRPSAGSQDGVRAPGPDAAAGGATKAASSGCCGRASPRHLPQHGRAAVAGEAPSGRGGLRRTSLPGRSGPALGDSGMTPRRQVSQLVAGSWRAGPGGTDGALTAARLPSAPGRPARPALPT